jgi:tripartite-type tricarboxylate transporter receptor subunit TctC
MKLSALAAAALVGISLAATAQAEDFYRGKTLKIVVASDPGGGYDAYARTLAQYFRQHIPGEPTVVVQNMAGAGGITATNWGYNVAPHDGTTIVMSQRGVPFFPFFGNPSAKFDPTKYNWIGSMNDEVGAIAIWKTSKVKSIEDARKEVAILGGSGPNDSQTYPALMNNTIGTKFKIVSGYPSTTAVQLAMERGEADGISQSWSSLKVDKADWVKNDKINVIVQIGRQKHPDLPNVPLIMDYVQGDENKAIWNVMLAMAALGRPFAAPPGVPAEQVRTLRQAFDATIKDPAFVATMEKSRRELTPVSGEAMQAMIADVARTPKAVLGKIDRLTTP